MLRKFILGKLNELLDDRKDGVQKARESISVWTGRAKAILAALESLSAKLEDNKLESEELEAAVRELKRLVESWS